MTTPTVTSRTRVSAGVFGVGVVAVLLTGCARLTSAPAASSSSAPTLTARPYPSWTTSGSSPAVRLPASAHGASVDAVALDGVKAIEASDTTLDADPNDTVKRAAAWLTPRFAAQVRAYPPVVAPGAQWNEWAVHRAYLIVTTSLAGDDHPVDSASTAYRQVVAVLHPIGRDGWHGPAQTEVVFVTLAPVHGQWRLATAQAS